MLFRSGLGLPICKAIVEACGGDIGFISEVGVGSTFWAWFPCDAKIPDNIYRESSKIGMSSMNASKCCNDKALNILVAEDNNSNYLLVEAILKNHNLTRAKNGAEAVEFATNIKYDVILMDIRMPVMDGLEATNRIRCFDKLTPIIAVTANAFDSDQVYAKEAGCNAFVSKPLKKKKLEEVLLNICK